jgi:hypothetical protein
VVGASEMVEISSYTALLLVRVRVAINIIPLTMLRGSDMI